MKIKDCVLVFECYHGGKHSKRMALTAKKWFGASPRISSGRCKQSYAIPVVYYDRSIRPLEDIANSVQWFISHAKDKLDDTFLVTRVGTDVPDYRDTDIAPMFKDAPPNCILPKCWNIPTCHSHEVYQIFNSDLERDVM